MTEVKGYHAHVYYDAATKPKAAKLRETIIGKFKVEPGGFSDEPRGPHPHHARPGREYDVTPAFDIDDGLALAQLQRWAPTAATRHKILVENPARLYGF